MWSYYIKHQGSGNLCRKEEYIDPYSQWWQKHKTDKKKKYRKKAGDKEKERN